MSSFLINKLYNIVSCNQTDNSVSATVQLNASHEVFKGHFPSIPVVPGVCQVQILKELLEDKIGRNLKLIAGDNIKFTGMILPDKNQIINIEMNTITNGDEYSVDAKLFFEDTIFTKFKGKFKA